MASSWMKRSAWCDGWCERQLRRAASRVNRRTPLSCMNYVVWVTCAGRVGKAALSEALRPTPALLLGAGVADGAGQAARAAR